MNILLLSRRQSFQLIIDELASVGEVTLETEKLNPSCFSMQFDVAVSYSYDHIIPAEMLEFIGGTCNQRPSLVSSIRARYLSYSECSLSWAPTRHLHTSIRQGH